MANMTSTINFVYKIYPITSAFEFPQPLASDTKFPWDPLDASSNYFHMSTAIQIPSTLSFFFNSYEEVRLVKIAYNKLNAAKTVKWELADDGKEYPHLYGMLEGQFVQGVKVVQKGDSWETTSKQLVENGWLEP